MPDQWIPRWMARGAGCLIFMLGASAGAAQPLPALPEADRPGWAAVGRVNGAGIGTRTGCSGTLIAPDLVLTAAHCVQAQHSIPVQRHFVAGWDRGDFAAHEVSREVLVHPAYATAEGTRRLAVDLALLRLEHPIDPARAQPLRLWASRSALPGVSALLGYHTARPHVLNGRFDCAPAPAPARGVFRIACEVLAGNSGGPVLVDQGDGWRLAAVISARGGPDGDALAAPVDAWVRSHWRAARQRAAAASGRE